MFLEKRFHLTCLFLEQRISVAKTNFELNKLDLDLDINQGLVSYVLTAEMSRHVLTIVSYVCI